MNLLNPKKILVGVVTFWIVFGQPSLILVRAQETPTSQPSATVDQSGTDEEDGPPDGLPTTYADGEEPLGPYATTPLQDGLATIDNTTLQMVPKYYLGSRFEVDPVTKQKVGIKAPTPGSQKQLVLNPDDLTGIREGQADQRLVESLTYLTDPKYDYRGYLMPRDQRGAGHVRIKATLHHTYAQKSATVNQDNPDQPYVVSNALWQGAEITELDNVSCRLKIKAVAKTKYKDLPPTPIKVLWQSDQGLQQGRPGLAGATINEMLMAAGGGSLTSIFSETDIANLMKQFHGKSLGDWAILIGAAALAQELGVDLKGDNLWSVFENGGKAMIAKALGLPPDGLQGGSLDEILTNIGRSVLESNLQLPSGALAGTSNNGQISPDSILATIGQRIIEDKVLQVRPWSLSLPYNNAAGFNEVLGKTLVEEYVGLPQGSMTNRRDKNGQLVDVNTVNDAKQGVTNERFDSAFAQPGSVDNNFGISEGTTAAFVNHPDDSGSFHSYFQKVGDAYLERFRNFRDYTYTKKDQNGDNVQITENFRDRLQELPNGVFGSIIDGKRDAFRSIGVATMAKTLGGSIEHNRTAFQTWIDKKDFGIKVQVAQDDKGQPIIVQFQDLEPGPNGLYDLLGNDLQRIFGTGEAADVYHHHGERALLNGVKPIAQKELGQNRLGGKVVSTFESIKDIADALGDIKTRLDRLDQTVNGAENKARLAKLHKRAGDLNGSLDNGKAHEALSEMKAVLADLKNGTAQNVQDDISAIERDMGKIATIIQDLTGEQISPHGVGGSNGWTVDKLPVNEQVPLLGITRGQLFDALVGTKNLRDLLINVGSVKWEQSFNLPRHSLQYFLDRSKDLGGAPYSEATLQESVGKAYLEQEGRKPGDYSRDQWSSIGKAVLERSVAGEIEDRFNLKAGSYKLTPADLVGLFHGQWQRVAVKIGAAQLNLALEWPEDSPGFLKIIDDPQSTAQKGSPTFLDILEEGFTYKLALAVGLKHPFSLSGNIRDNIGAVSVEDRLGLVPGSFHDSIAKVVSATGGERFASGFNINLPADVRSQIEQVRQSILQEYGTSSAGAQELQRQTDQIISDFLFVQVLSPERTAWWRDSNNQNALKRTDAILGIDIGSTSDLLDGTLQVADYAHRAGKGTATTIAATVADSYFHLSKELGLPEGTIGIIAGLIGKDNLTDQDKNTLLGLFEKVAGVSLDGAINDAIGGNTDPNNGPTHIIWPTGTIANILQHPGQTQMILTDVGIRIVADQIGRSVNLGNLNIDAYTLLRVGMAYFTDQKVNINGQAVYVYQQGVSAFLRAGIWALTGGSTAIVNSVGDPQDPSFRVSLGGAGFDIDPDGKGTYTSLLMRGDTRAIQLVGLGFVANQINYYDNSGTKTPVPVNLQIGWEDLVKALFGDPKAEDDAVIAAQKQYQELHGNDPNYSSEIESSDLLQINHDARWEVRQGYQKNLTYKLLDSLAYRNGLTQIPKDFAKRLIEGNPRDRGEALVEFIANIVGANNPGLGLDGTVINELYHYFYDDPNGKDSKFHQANNLSPNTFRAVTNLMQKITGWNDLPVDFVGSIFYSIQDGWQHEQQFTNGEFKFTSYDPNGKDFADTFVRWSVDGLGNWATKHWGIPAGGIRQIFDAYTAYRQARDAYLLSKIFSGSDFAGFHAAAKEQLNNARFALINLVVDIGFSKTFSSIEEKHHLPPGTMRAAVTLVLGAIMHAHFDVIGPMMTVVNGVFGDDFAAFEEKNNLPRGITSAGVQVGLTYLAINETWVSGSAAKLALQGAWAAFVLIALFSPFDVEYQCQRPPPSKAIGQPAYGEALTSYTPAWDNGNDLGLWKRWAQYETNRVIGELVVGLPARFGADALPSQIETLRQEDVASWGLQVDAAYGPAQQRGDYYGVGYGGLPDRVHYGY